MRFTAVNRPDANGDQPPLACALVHISNDIADLLWQEGFGHVLRRDSPDEMIRAGQQLYSSLRAIIKLDFDRLRDNHRRREAGRVNQSIADRSRGRLVLEENGILSSRSSFHHRWKKIVSPVYREKVRKTKDEFGKTNAADVRVSLKGLIDKLERDSRGILDEISRNTKLNDRIYQNLYKIEQLKSNRSFPCTPSQSSTHRASI